MVNKKIRDTCELCNKPVRRFRIYENLMLCYKCFIKQPGIIGNMGRPRLTLKEALDKTYYVRFFEYKDQTAANISVSSILAGHRVKLILADENEEVNKV